MFWRLWLRSVSVKRPQAALAVGSLLVGAALTSTLLNLYGDVQRKMNQELRAFGPNVVVAPVPEQSALATSQLETRGSSGVMDERVLDRLKESGITAVPSLYVATRLERTNSDPRLRQFENAVAVGTEFAALRRLYPGWRIAGANASENSANPGACALGARLASRLRLRPSDRIQLEVAGEPTRAGRPQRQTYRIAEIVSTGTGEEDQLFLPLSSLQSLAGLEGRISLVQLSVPGETREVERVIRALSAAFPDLEVRPIRQIVYSEGKVLTIIGWLLFLLTALILVITGICVAATMTAIVLDRRKDVAVMKALGASNGLVMELFLTEGATLGFASGAAGFAVGSVLAQYLGRRLFGVALSPVWWSFPAVCFATVLLTVLATAFPVKMVRSIEPARVLKGA